MNIAKAKEQGAKMEKKAETNVTVFQKIFQELDNAMSRIETLSKQLDGDEAIYVGKIVSDLMDWAQEVGTMLEPKD